MNTERIAKQMTTAFLDQYKADRILSAKRLFVSNGDLYAVGEIVELSTEITFYQEVMKFFGFYKRPTYEVLKVVRDCLWLVNSGITPESYIADWSVLPESKGDVVTFRRPLEY